MKHEITVAIDVRNELGEGPTWDASAETLLWVDIEGRRVHGHAVGDDWSVDVQPRPGAVVPSRSGGYVVIAEQAFYALDRERGKLTLLTDVSAHEQPTSRMNDGKCDPQGRFWAGTTASRATPRTAHLYRLDGDGSVHTMLDGVSTSNGLGWSPDGATMYYTDTPLRTIDAFDFDGGSGTITNRRNLIDFADQRGAPDGLTVDAEGCLWVAMWGGWELRRYTPAGALDLTVEMPVQNVTSCSFGGPGLADLFVTSARHMLDAEQLAAQPLAGAVFHVGSGAVGLPATPYGG